MKFYLSGKFDINIADLLHHFQDTREEYRLIINPCYLISGFTFDMNNIEELEFIKEQGTQEWLYVTYKDGRKVTYDDWQTIAPQAQVILYGSIYYDLIPIGMLQNDIEELTIPNGENIIFLFRLNDERNKLDKNLININIVSGQYRSTINLTKLTLDLVNYDRNNLFNYVYIPALKRYYYVDSVEFKSNQITGFELSVDVLMSHRDLIRKQSGFVERNQYTYNSNIIDDEYITGFEPLIEYNKLTYLNNIFDLSISQRTPGQFILTVISCLPT